MRISLFLFFLLQFSILTDAQKTIERVEPPNWWADMVHEGLQLMVYGKNIQSLSPKVNYAGLELKNVVHPSNKNYIFINLEMDGNLKPGTANIEFYQDDKLVITHPYRFEKREAGSAERKGFDNRDLLYLITPDRFVNGDTKNDEVTGMREGINRENPGGRHGGDIAGISSSLDYIKEMGFTAIWLNPLLENDMEEYSYHGYSTTDYYKVDSRYGSNDSYRALSKKAKSMGIGMIMDMIVNHCGSFHWWMEDLPSEDWINQWPTYQGTNHRKTLTQDPYAANIDKKIFTDGWFVPTMPDLNQNNEYMANYLTQNAIWWIEYADLTGIRMDTYPYPVATYMTEWTARVMKEYPNFNVVGEEWFGSPTIVSQWQKGKVNTNGLTSDLKSMMDFPLQVAVKEALTAEESFGTGWIKIYELLGQDFVYPSPMDLVTFPDNHDMDRFFTQVNENLDHFKLGLIFYATTRGVPQIYYGTEILMNNSAAPGDHGIIRSDFPGGWSGDEINAFTGAGLSDSQKEAQQFSKKLFNWRKNASAVHFGSLKHFIPQDGVYVYFRESEGQKIMVVLNKNEIENELKLDRFKEELSGIISGKDVLSGNTVLLQNSLKVSGKNGVILELK